MVVHLKKAFTDPQVYRGVAGAIIFLVLWYLAAVVFKLPRFSQIPDPVAVARAWVDLHPASGRSMFTAVYYADMLLSLKRVLIAFALATTLGVTLGLFMGWSLRFYDYTFPIVEILRPMPPLSWIPLAVLILPGTETAVVYVTFIAAFFATVLNTLLGVRSIDNNYFLAAKCLGSRPKDIFFNVVLPGALPFIFTGLQISMGIAWMSLVAGEIISGSGGLGYAIYETYSLFQYTEVIFYMITLGFLGYISSVGIRAVGHKLMAWEAGRRGL
jgi:NitT/TauT family transport system permease protein